MRMRWILTGVLAAYGLPCVAQIEAPSSGFHVAPIINAVRTDSDRSVDDNAAFTLALGAEVHPRWNVELSLFRGRFDGVGGDDLVMDAAGLNALRVFRRDARVAPYVLVGLGAQRKDREVSTTSTDLYEDLGAGLLARLRRAEDAGRALFLRLDARARHDETDGRSRVDYLFGLGLQYAFGSTPVSRELPLTPAPAPVPSPAAPPADADGDGVPDANDLCPGTLPGRAVDAQGCEVDGDGDGVRNPADACPDTRQGARVDARGCEIEKEIRLPRVTFEYNSDRLQPEAFATLDEAVETLRMNPDLRIEVAGHTDSSGSDAYNLSLSQRRAEAVRRYLVDHGVTNALTSRGYGESDPIADNGTEAGRAENRRVLLRILPP